MACTLYIASSQGNQFEFNPNFVYLHTNICSLSCLEDCITHNQGNWSEFNPTFICYRIDLFILDSQLTHFHCTQPRDILGLFVCTKIITMTNCKFNLTCVKFAKGNYFGCRTLNAWVHRCRCASAQKWHLTIINDPLITSTSLLTSDVAPLCCWHDMMWCWHGRWWCGADVTLWWHGKWWHDTLMTWLISMCAHGMEMMWMMLMWG